MSITPPQNKDPLALFEYSVRKVISLGMMDEAKTHQAWANLIFGYEKKSYDRSDLMSIVKREYSQYFNEELQYKFLEDKIRMTFPHLFGLKEDQDIFVRMLRALEAECIQQKDPRNQKVYRVATCENITIQDKKYVYNENSKSARPLSPMGMPRSGVPHNLHVCSTESRCRLPSRQPCQMDGILTV